MIDYKKLSFALVLVMIFTAIFAGEALAQEDREGDRLIVAYPEDVATFDLQATTSPPNEVRHLVFEPLFAFNQDMEPQPILAEDWEYNEDDLYWDIKIREGVEFHDGEEVTSADVVASFERYQDIGARSFQVDSVEEVEALDNYTVRFHLDSPFGTLVESLSETSGVFAVYPEWLVDEYRDEELRDNYIGTGPYEVEEVAVGEYYILTKNDDYQPNPEAEGGFLAERESYIDELEIRVIEEDAARVAALQAGDVDLIQSVPLDDYEILQDDPDVEALPTSPGYRVYYKFNTTQEPFDDPLLRKGIRAGLDPEEIMWTQGPEDLWRINHTPRYQEEQIWWTDQSHLYPEDMELAQKLVDASDYDGEEIEFLVSPGRALEYNTVIVMEEYLRDLGLNVEIRSVDAATFGDVRAQMDEWNIKHAGGGSMVGPVYLDSSFVDRTGERWPTTENVILDHYMEILEEEQDVEARKEAIDHIYRLNAEYVNEMWVGDVFQVAGFRNHVMGVQDSFKLPLFGLWLEE